MASRIQELREYEYLHVMAQNPVKGLPYQKPDLSGHKVSGAQVPSEGLTPRRVYSENNGAGYLSKPCKTCGNTFRQIESRGATPGSMAVKVTDAQGKVQWFLPLDAEYMLHNRRNKPASERELAFNGKVQVWILPGTSRKAIKVQGPCQAVKLAKVQRKDECGKCYHKRMREIASGERKYNHEATIKIRKAGSKTDIRIVRQRIDAETCSVAAILSTRRVSVRKPAKQLAIPTQATVYNEPRLFGAYLIKNGESVKGYTEARTISEARKGLAISLGVDLAEMAGRNIYVVLRPNRGLSTEEWKRVA